MNHQVSPFFSRAYGGYTLPQIEFYMERIGDPAGIEILDPMGGQAFALSQLALKGARISLGDLNAAPLLLASLRAPELIDNRDQLRSWLKEVLAGIKRRRRRPPNNIVVSDWLSDRLKADLKVLSSHLGVGLFSNLQAPGFWTQHREIRFVCAIAVLAARELTCFRKSDNRAWLMPGGIDKDCKLGDALMNALDQWFKWAEVASRLINRSQLGTISPQLLNVEKGPIPFRQKFDVIVTSPPYANRLDYTRLWGPETAVASYLSGSSVDEIKPALLGTTCVAGTQAYESEVKNLPLPIRRILCDIRDDNQRYSASYYYPFFRNYAIALSKGLETAASKLRKHGSMIVFVRDTVRKDTLFPAGDLVKRVLTKKRIGLSHVESKRQVIKGHIGNIRQGASSGIYGKAQLEWWMHFKKK